MTGCECVPRAAAPRRLMFLLAGLLSVLGACRTPALELSGLAELPPLDYSVWVTGDACAVSTGTRGTFLDGIEAPVPQPIESLSIERVLGSLRDGQVFQQSAADQDALRRRQVRLQLVEAGAAAVEGLHLEQLRDEGFDLVLVLEEVQDRPIESQGINNRWPVTFATWLLLGVGVFIPDHTFESRAVLRASLRDLQTGDILSDHLLVAGPVDLSLVERSNFWGLLLSIVVPPFWVHDDVDNVWAGVREITARRLLLQLARDLKSEAVRQRLAQRLAVAFRVESGRVLASSRQSLRAVRLKPSNGLGMKVAW